MTNKNTTKAIKNYVAKLPPALKERYGGSGKFGYTEGQVTTTVNELKLSQEHIKYAMLLFCGEDVLIKNGEDSDNILKMIDSLKAIAGGGGDSSIGVAGSSGFFVGVFDVSADGGDGGGGGGE